MKNILKSLSFYYSIVRNVGHTMSLVNGLKNSPDSIFITHTKKYGNEILKRNGLKNRVISLSESESLLRGFRYPLVIDNHALKMIFEETFEEIVDLEKKLENERESHKKTKVALEKEIKDLILEKSELEKQLENDVFYYRSEFFKMLDKRNEQHIVLFVYYILLIICMYISIF